MQIYNKRVIGNWNRNLCNDYSFVQHRVLTHTTQIDDKNYAFDLGSSPTDLNYLKHYE